MKVFQINTVYNTGSTGRIAAQIKHAVEANGGECITAYGRGFSEEKNTFKIGSKADMYIHALMTRITDKTAFYSKKNTKRLIERIKEFAPDIIHLHNLHGYYVNVELLFDFFKEYDKPIVWTLHDCWTFTGHCPYYSAVACEQWKEHCTRCPQKRKYPASMLLDNCKQNFERKQKAFRGVSKMVFVTPSKWLEEEVKKSFLREYQVEVIPNGIDTTVFIPTTGDIRKRLNLEGKRIILAVANEWSERKGLSDFFKVAEQLDEKYAIVMVGLDEKQINKLPSQIVGIQKTNNVQELAELYTEAQVFLNLTYEDNFPSVNLEALACGTPVITYKTGGSPEALDDKTGICIEQGDIEGVIKAIEQSLVLRKEDCINRGHHFDSSKRYKEYLELYSAILQ